MNFIELVGFVVTIVAFFLLSIKQSMDRRKRASQEPYEEEEENDFDEVLKSMGLEVKKERPVTKKVKVPTPPVVHKEEVEKKPALEKLFKDHFILGDLHKDAYSLEPSKGSKAKKLFRGGSLREAIILREILGPPKALDDSRK